MKPWQKKALVWTPRVLSALFALFLSLFALDVFGEGYGFWKTLGALFMHLLPVFALLIALAIAWRWTWVGALMFGGFSLSYISAAWGNLPWPTLVIIAGPPAMIAALYLFDWIRRDELRTGSR